jgi:signal transduction histidine kinase
MSGAAHVSDRAGPRLRKGLSLKLALSFIALVSLVLMVNGAINMWLSYGEAKRAAVLVQQEKAQAAAERIEQFIGEIEQQIGWTTHAQWSAGTMDQRRYDFVRLLRQVPAITELVQIDGAGKEQLKVSRLAMDVIGSGADLSADPRFAKAAAGKVWFSPVYFRKESEPYITISLAHVGRNAGVTVAEVNLKFIWDVVTAMKIGRAGYAYVVNGQGRLIAHPDISLVLRDTDLSRLSQVADALAARQESGPQAASVAAAGGPEGGLVLTAYAPIARLDWLVFVELPLGEAMAPVYASLLQTGALLGLGLLLAAAAGTVLARRMVVPIRRLQLGAERLGTGELDHRIEIRTGDEIEVLADRFNRMGAQLQESYATLEQKVAERTRELSEALEQQTATAEVLKVISASPGELGPVFDAMLTNARRICEAQSGVLWLYENGSYRPAAFQGIPAAYEPFLHEAIDLGSESGLAQATRLRQIVQIPDARNSDAYRKGDRLVVAAVDLGGVRTVLVVPMFLEARLVGAFSVYRRESRPFSNKQVELVATFANQAVIAIENARLLGELRDRSADLARSVEELTTLREVGQAVSSTLDLATVLQTIVARAVALAGADAGAIFRYRKADRQFRLGTSHGFDEQLTAKILAAGIREEETTALSRAISERAPVQLPDLDAVPHLPLRDLTVAAGFRAVLIVPLVGADRVFGVLAIQKKTLGAFPEDTVKLMQTFASQSVLAIQNARLFREVEEQGRALALASQHKSQFLANMSHELRTPLNAILGYAELLVDGIYGELSEKARSVLDRVQSNGRHLLGLINDVLDLSKIEAGQLTLTVEDYAMPAVVHSVVSATESLASAKGLSLAASVPRDLPLGYGDERRLTQVLLNLVGNAIKFTDAGSVQVSVCVAKDCFDVAVSDTGPGIAAEDKARIFEEFQQVDNSNTRRKGGSGLGLAISRRIVDLHGGTITVESEIGKGSTFHVIIPVRVASAREVA